MSDLVRNDLSKDAHAVAGGLFGLMAPGRGQVTFQTPSRIHSRTRAALDELVAAGLIEVGPTNPPGGLEYTALGNFRPFMKWLSMHENDHDVKFPIVISEPHHD